MRGGTGFRGCRGGKIVRETRGVLISWGLSTLTLGACGAMLAEGQSWCLYRSLGRVLRGG